MSSTATLPLIAPAANEASIRSAALKLSQVGGGIVQLPAATITLTQALPAYNGVTYEGAGYQADFQGGQTTSKGGTTFVGDGTFNGFEFNPIDGSTPPSGTQQQFVAAMLNGAGVRGINFVNFAYGIKVGSLYNPGAIYCDFLGNSFINCQQWGVWVENYINCKFKYNSTSNCQVGGLARVCSGGAAGVGLFGGNSDFKGTYVICPPSLYVRGIVSWARGAGSGSQKNDDRSFGEQVNRSAITTLSQVATFTNTSTSIGVTDSTEFPVGLPVTFSNSVAGFVANEIYFVLSSAANALTLGATTYGSAIAATAGTTTNILSNGYPNLEIAALDSTCLVTAETVLAVDLESYATMTVFMQLARYCTVEGGLIAPYSGAGSPTYQTLVMRNCLQCSFKSKNNAKIDLDNVSGSNWIEALFQDWQAVDFTASRGVGIGIGMNNAAGQRAAQNSGVLRLKGFTTNDAYVNRDTALFELARGLSMSPNQIASGGSAAPTTGSLFVFTTGAGGTLSLPAISTYAPGSIILISNPQANAVTVSTAGELINGVAATTSFNLAANSNSILIPCDAGGSIGKYWAKFI